MISQNLVEPDASTVKFSQVNVELAFSLSIKSLIRTDEFDVCRTLQYSGHTGTHCL